MGLKRWRPYGAQSALAYGASEIAAVASAHRGKRERNRSNCLRASRQPSVKSQPLLACIAANANEIAANAECIAASDDRCSTKEDSHSAREASIAANEGHLAAFASG
jgi:hypothetical protein